jgi:hypothetical protein
MRMETSSSQQEQGTSAAESRERRPVHNASSKVSLVVQRMLFPMLDSPMRTHVLLDTDEEQVELDLLDQLDRTRPGLMEDHGSFVQHLVGLLERDRRFQGYAPVLTNAAGSSNPA